jgi:hypothetical protein
MPCKARNEYPPIKLQFKNKGALKRILDASGEADVNYTRAKEIITIYSVNSAT